MKKPLDPASAVTAPVTQPSMAPETASSDLAESAVRGAEAASREDTSRTVLKEGARVAWPICLGYFPIGLAFGVLAQKAGLHPVEIGLMSIVVFAGSSQFIAVSMLTSGASMLSIILTTFVVNLRHVLMSSSLAVHLGLSSRRFLTAFAYGITDESFAVNTARFRDGHTDRHTALVVNQTANAAWVMSTILGGYCGQFIPERSFGIDYALSAMFLCLLVYQLRGRIYVLTALASGILATILAILIPGNSYVMLASLLAATMGLALRRHAQRKAPHHA